MIRDQDRCACLCHISTARLRSRFDMEVVSHINQRTVQSPARLRKVTAPLVIERCVETGHRGKAQGGNRRAAWNEYIAALDGRERCVQRRTLPVRPSPYPCSP